MEFIGIDIHTNRFTCCYRTDRDKAKRMATYELNQEGLAQFYQTLTKDTHVLVEAMTNTFAFVRLFEGLVAEVIVANTYDLKDVNLTGLNKTDKIDADKLCRIMKLQVLGGEQLVRPVTIPPKEISDLRDLFSTYRLFRKETTQMKNRIHSLLKEHLYPFTQEQIFSKAKRQLIRAIGTDEVLTLQLNVLFDELESLEKRITSLEGMIQKAAAPYAKEIDILTSMAGVSVFIAIAIIADIIDVNRFKNAKMFTSYLRSAPVVKSSNEKTSNGHTNRRGRKLAAVLLSQALEHLMKASPKLRTWYDRLCQYKKPGLVRTALRRRAFTELYQMLKKGEYHYGMNPQLHEKKMKQYKRFLEKNTISCAFFEETS